MTKEYTFEPQREKASAVPADPKRARQPQYGRYLEDFEPGQVFAHPRGYTFDFAGAQIFARTYMQTNPLYLNREAARAAGFRDAPASPQQVFNVALSLGVQNNSEKAMANLGYYDARFIRPVYPGDTLRALSLVLNRRERGEGKPGIVHMRTLALNQKEEAVLQYERKIMIPERPHGSISPKTPGSRPDFPEVSSAVFLPEFGEIPAHTTGSGTYFENFAPGDILLHKSGRTVSDEHMAQTYLVGNTHPLHYDAVYAGGLSGAMGGRPVVYGGLVFAWLEGLASRDVSENAFFELGFTEGYHTQPTFSGDTLYAVTRVLDAENAPGDLNLRAGVVTLQLIGLKNLCGADALERYGKELFEKENAKPKQGKQKIEAKVFEIERRLLVRRSP